jgi:hypothetical protein
MQVMVGLGLTGFDGVGAVEILSTWNGVYRLGWALGRAVSVFVKSGSQARASFAVVLPWLGTRIRLGGPCSFRDSHSYAPTLLPREVFGLWIVPSARLPKFAMYSPGLSGGRLGKPTGQWVVLANNPPHLLVG